MAYLDIYAQLVIFDGNSTRLVPPHPRPLYGITSAYGGYTGFLAPDEVSGSNSVELLLASMKVKETVSIVRSTDTFSMDLFSAYQSNSPTILIVEFDLLDGPRIDVSILGVFQAKITQFERHTSATPHADNAEKIVFEFEKANVRYTPNTDPRLSQYGYMTRRQTSKLKKGQVLN